MHSLVDSAVGSVLTEVEGVFASGNHEALIAVTFTFEGRALTLSADPNTDSVLVEERTARDTQTPDVRIGIVRPLEPFVGSVLCGAWLCYDAPGHCDAIDLGFGDLVRPTIKILCVASELLLLPISREFPSKR